MLKCCICGYEIVGLGNNPKPLDNTEGARCCDVCNMKVTEARIEAILPSKYRRKKEENTNE